MALKTILHFRAARSKDGSPCDQHQVMAWCDALQQRLGRGTQQALGAVALHRPAYAAPGGYTHAHLVNIIGQNYKHNKRVRV